MSAALAAAVLLGAPLASRAAEPGPPKDFSLQTADPAMLGQFMVGKFRYETTPPVLPAGLKHPAVLVFSKTNGYREDKAVQASIVVLRKMAADRGWSAAVTENGAVFNTEQLKSFDAVVFDNTSGDTLTPQQQAAFKAYLELGGGFVGIHGAGGDPLYFWHWYVTDVIGAQFMGHPMHPQFQQATIRIEDRKHPATRGLGAAWVRTDEWYSFQFSPRARVHVLASLDERTYNPEGLLHDDLRMGDHPVIWEHCVGKGRVFYSALGHAAETYSEPKHVQMLAGAISWAMGLEGSKCVAGKEVARR